ncbi:replication protein RepA4 [Salmonella enterica]|nr:replication protein RepA4 [Salmonella enterica]
MCAVGVVTARQKPQPWRISALAGHQGRLRACYSYPPARTTNSHSKV